MAIKKSTPTPKPTTKGSGKPVVKITKVTKPLTKTVVRNPQAPTGTGSGSGTGSVRPITKSETAMKKGQVSGSNVGSSKNVTVPKGGDWPSSYPAKYKKYVPSWFTEEQRLKKIGCQDAEGKKRTASKMRSTNPRGSMGGFLGGGGLFDQIK